MDNAMVTLRAEGDPAYDADKSEWKKYAIDFDESHLVTVAGGEPCKFICSMPTLPDRVKYRDMEHMPNTLGLACFMKHVKCVEGCRGEPWSDKFSLRHGMVTDRWLENSGLTTDEITSVGLHIHLFSILKEEERKNS